MKLEHHNKKWVVGHIIPQYRFDLTRDKDIKLCWHFTNLYPAPATHRNAVPHDSIMILKQRKKACRHHKAIIDKLIDKAQTFYMEQTQGE
jgi:hypothetical protein